eukprot:jgi/Psemu1/189981/e_gw1.95.15.1
MRCSVWNNRLKLQFTKVRLLLGKDVATRKIVRSVLRPLLTLHKSLGYSSSSISDGCRADVGGSIHSKFDFDHEHWWTENGHIIRQLLDGKYSRSRKVLFNDERNCFSSNNLLGDRFEQVYASDAIYQDLFIDTPPCRDTMKLSFHLIHRFWDVNVTKLDPPILMRSIECDHNKEAKRNGSTGIKVTTTTTAAAATEPIGNSRCLRVSYTVTQRPRISFLSSNIDKSFKLIQRLQRIEYNYEGWIDLYLRPKSSQSQTSDTNTGMNNNLRTTGFEDNDPDWVKRNDWEVYRHDDRLRVFPPKVLHRYIANIDQNRENVIDALTIVERTPLISKIFQQLRLVHGKAVHYFTKTKEI